MSRIPEGVIFETRDVLLSYFERATFVDLINFRDKPIEILKRLGVAIVNQIDSNQIEQLTTYIKTILNSVIEKFANTFKKYTKCLACKIALTILLFALASVLNISIDTFASHFNEIVDLLVAFFNKSAQELTRLLNVWGFPTLIVLGVFEIKDFIEKLCAEFGYCR